jgi:hypothetical protein
MSVQKTFHELLGIKEKQEVVSAKVHAVSPSSIDLILSNGRVIKCTNDAIAGELYIGDNVLVSLGLGGQGSIIKKVTDRSPAASNHYIIP